MKLFDEIPYLEDNFIILRRIVEADAAAIDEMYSDPKMPKCLPTFLFEAQFADKKEAIRQIYAGLFERKESLLLAICLKEEPDQLVGIAEFYNYDPNWNKVSLGCRLNSRVWHRGIAERTGKLMRTYLFERTDVKRVTLHIMVENVYSLKSALGMDYRLRAVNVEEDWGFEKPVLVNKYVCEKIGNIPYVKIGNGPKTMVMLPGLAFKSTLGSADLIEAAYGKLFEEYTIYLFDDRSNLHDGYSIRERAGDVAAEMHTLGIKGACVFGASMGGMVAQYLAIDHPKLVKKIVMTSTASYIDEGTRQVVEKWQDMAERNEMEQLIHEMIGDIYSTKTVRESGKLIEEGMGVISDRERENFLTLTKAILDFNCYEELDRIRCPVLVVGSEGDRVIDPASIRATAERIGAEQFWYNDSYGHGVYDEAADHRQRMLDFFER